MTLGERLKNARKQRGLALREVAETTKIREEYLEAIEKDSTDIDLPEVYVRGFIRNYIKYMHLDPEKVFAEVENSPYIHTQIPKEDQSRDILGELSIQANETPTGSTSSRTIITSDEEAPVADDKTESDDEAATDESVLNINLTPQMKRGLTIGASVAAALIVVIWALIAFSGGSGQAPLPRPPVNQMVSEYPRQEIVLSASENVPVTVDQLAGNKRLFNRTLRRGESITLEKQGPVKVSYTKGSALTLEIDGRIYRMPDPGLGSARFD